MGGFSGFGVFVWALRALGMLGLSFFCCRSLCFVRAWGVEGLGWSWGGGGIRGFRFFWVGERMG